VGKERDGAEKQPEDSESKSEKNDRDAGEKMFSMGDDGEEEKSFDYKYST
jgi:hypothetical protein